MAIKNHIGMGGNNRKIRLHIEAKIKTKRKKKANPLLRKFSEMRRSANKPINEEEPMITPIIVALCVCNEIT